MELSNTDKAFLYSKQLFRNDKTGNYKWCLISKYSYIMFLVQSYHTWIYNDVPFKEKFFIDIYNRQRYLEFEYFWYEKQQRLDYGAFFNIDKNLARSVEYVFRKYWNVDIEKLDELIENNFLCVKQAKEKVTVKFPMQFISNRDIIRDLNKDSCEVTWEWERPKILKL